MTSHVGGEGNEEGGKKKDKSMVQATTGSGGGGGGGSVSKQPQRSINVFKPNMRLFLGVSACSCEIGGRIVTVPSTKTGRKITNSVLNSDCIFLATRLIWRETT